MVDIEEKKDPSKMSVSEIKEQMDKNKEKAGEVIVQQTDYNLGIPQAPPEPKKPKKKDLFKDLFKSGISVGQKRKMDAQTRRLMALAEMKKGEGRLAAASVAERQESRLRMEDKEVLLRDIAGRKFGAEEGTGKELRDISMARMKQQLSLRDKLNAQRAEAQFKEQLRKKQERPVSLEISRLFQPGTRVTALPPIKVVPRKKKELPQTRSRKTFPARKGTVFPRNKPVSKGWWKQSRRHSTTAKKVWQKKKKG